MSLITLLVVGRSKVGKSTASHFIARALNGTVVNVGDIIAEILQAERVHVDNRAALGPALEKRGLTHELLLRLTDRLKVASGVIVIDGVRLPEVEAVATRAADQRVGVHVARRVPLGPAAPTRYDPFTDAFANRADVEILNEDGVDELRRKVIAGVVEMLGQER